MNRFCRTAAVWVLAAGLGLAASAGAQTIPSIPDLPAGTPAIESRVSMGLREALTVGAENAVTRTGRMDGFFKNAAIKILMPEKLRTAETALRAIGYSPQVDDFILAMNRAAERAAASAKPIFVDAIRKITFQDAKAILTGSDTGATEYFRSHTQDALAAAFRPIVQRATDEFGVTRQYKDLVRGLPFASPQSLDIDTYVVGKTLDGLFFVLGEEEKKIREDPAARVTAILREVFGR